MLGSSAKIGIVPPSLSKQNEVEIKKKSHPAPIWIPLHTQSHPHWSTPREVLQGPLPRFLTSHREIHCDSVKKKGQPRRSGFPCVEKNVCDRIPLTVIRLSRLHGAMDACQQFSGFRCFKNGITSGQFRSLSIVRQWGVVQMLPVSKKTCRDHLIIPETWFLNLNQPIIDLAKRPRPLLVARLSRNHITGPSNPEDRQFWLVTPYSSFQFIGQHVGASCVIATWRTFLGCHIRLEFRYRDFVSLR